MPFAANVIFSVVAGGYVAGAAIASAAAWADT